MSPVNGDTVLYGHQVSTFQDGVQVYNNSEITGTLKFVEGGLAESGPLSGDGHFIALQLDSNSWSSYDSIQVGLKPSFDTGLVEIKDDPDRNIVAKVVSNEQVFTVRTTKDGVTEDKDYDLTTLYLEPKQLDPIHVTAVPGNETVYGVPVSELQSDMDIFNTYVNGNLSYHGELRMSGALSGAGHFLALEFNSDDWSDYDNIVVGIEESGDFPLVDIKEYADKKIVYKIENTSDILTVMTVKDGITNTTQYNLSNLVLLPHYYAPIIPQVTPGNTEVSASTFSFTVSDIQENVDIHTANIPGKENQVFIGGTLKYQSQGIGNNAPFNQPGYYLALYLDSSDWSSYPYIMVGDPENNNNYDLKNAQTHFGVIRVDKNNPDEKYTIIAPDSDATQVGKVTEYFLSNITFSS